MNFLKVTPLELDIQLQCAELVFRSILEGKRLNIADDGDIDEWHRETLGEAWVHQNAQQRQILKKQQDYTGENTPEWMESVSNMGDLAWEVFESTSCGETLRRLQDVDRTEVIELLRELYPKVRDSHYARCGAGERLYGLRACIALYRQFLEDPEVLDATAEVLKHCVQGVPYNRNGLAELSLPLPPVDRRLDTPERGWAFLRAALDAYMVQLGEQPWSWRPEDLKNRDFSDSDWDGSEAGDVDAGRGSKPDIDRTPRRSTAIKIAESIVAVREAPAIVVQLKLLREPTPEEAPVERKDLADMVPAVYVKTQEAIASSPSEVLSNLLDMLRLAVGSGPLVEEVGGSSGGDSGAPGAKGSDRKEEGSVLSGMLGGMRGFLGRGSAS